MNQFDKQLFIDQSINLKMKESSVRSTNRKQLKGNLGKIYSVKRQPLTQITHYPKSALIDDHFLDNINNTVNKNNIAKEKVIKFIGDQQENIQSIILTIESLNQCENKIMMQKEKNLIQQEFSQILNIFYHKLGKIRAERNSLKKKIETDKNQNQIRLQSMGAEIQQLKQQIVNLRKQKQCLVEKLDNQSRKRQFFQRQFQILQQKNKIPFIDQSHQMVNRCVANSDQQTPHLNFGNPKSFEGQSQCQVFANQFFNEPKRNMIKNMPSSAILQSTLLKCDDVNSSCVQTKLAEQVSIEQRQKLQEILRKYNLQPSELNKIIEQYLKQLKQEYQIQFQNEQQKRLYFLAKKMQNKIWNNKIKKDIQKLMLTKN